MRESFLMKPTEQPKAPPILALPGIDVSGDGKASSLLVIFSVWSTMVGSALVYLPANIQVSGIVLGVAICIWSYLISYYTCALIIKTAKNDADYVYTLKKYYGK
jgi:amino acid permease